MPTILVVDDDDAVRQVIGDHLSDAGLTVLSVADTASALKQLDSNPTIDLCIVDLVMPTGVPDGAEFARSARTRCPEVPIILITGYYAAALKIKDETIPIVYKPVDLDSLTGVVHSLIPRLSPG